MHAHDGKYKERNHGSGQRSHGEVLVARVEYEAERDLQARDDSCHEQQREDRRGPVAASPGRRGEGIGEAGELVATGDGLADDVTDEDAVRIGGRFQARRYVDGIAGGRLNFRHLPADILGRLGR